MRVGPRPGLPVSDGPRGARRGPRHGPHRGRLDARRPRVATRIACVGYATLLADLHGWLHRLPVPDRPGGRERRRRAAARAPEPLRSRHQPPARRSASRATSCSPPTVPSSSTGRTPSIGPPGADLAVTWLLIGAARAPHLPLERVPVAAAAEAVRPGLPGGGRPRRWRRAACPWPSSIGAVTPTSPPTSWRPWIASSPATDADRPGGDQPRGIRNPGAGIARDRPSLGGQPHRGCDVMAEASMAQEDTGRFERTHAVADGRRLGYADAGLAVRPPTGVLPRHPELPPRRRLAARRRRQRPAGGSSRSIGPASACPRPIPDAGVLDLADDVASLLDDARGRAGRGARLLRWRAVCARHRPPARRPGRPRRAGQRLGSS